MSQAQPGLQDCGGIASYHAHIYYDAATRPHAALLRAEIERRFTVEMGRWREQPTGPHPQSMYQVGFAADQFARIVPWLMLNHGELPVFIHPNSGDGYADHAFHDMWLGNKLKLVLDFLKPREI